MIPTILAVRFSSMVTLISFVVGASLTALIVILTVATFPSSSPSFALKVKESVPLKFAFGI